MHNNKRLLLVALTLTNLFFLTIAKVEKNKNQIKNQLNQTKSDKKRTDHSQNNSPKPKADTPELYVIDTIDAVIFGQKNQEIITSSELSRPSLTGAVRTLEDICFEYMVYFDGLGYGMLPDDASVDRSLAEIARANNLQMNELALIFNQAGLTYDEGRNELKKLQTVNSMLDFKIRQNLIVSRKAIEAYYNEHPEMQEPEYYLEYVFVPFANNKNTEKQKKELITFAKTGKGISGIEWSKPFWVEKSDVAEGKEFLFSMSVGSISEPQKTATGFELYRLKDKKEEHLKTLDERRLDIMDVLRRPKYTELLEEYKQRLYNLNSVLYF